MGAMSVWHWLIVVIALIVFGTKKLRNVGQDLGGAVKGFKDGMKGNGDRHATWATTADGSTATLARESARKD